MTTDKMTVALRVLAAINNHMNPDSEDVAFLRDNCSDRRDYDPDELACVVIQELIERRLVARNALKI